MLVEDLDSGFPCIKVIQKREYKYNRYNHALQLANTNHRQFILLREDNTLDSCAEFIFATKRWSESWTTFIKCSGRVDQWAPIS